VTLKTLSKIFKKKLKLKLVEENGISFNINMYSSVKKQGTGKRM
jgi:hypothetical protein